MRERERESSKRQHEIATTGDGKRKFWRYIFSFFLYFEFSTLFSFLFFYIYCVCKPSLWFSIILTIVSWSVCLLAIVTRHYTARNCKIHVATRKAQSQNRAEVSKLPFPVSCCCYFILSFRTLSLSLSHSVYLSLCLPICSLSQSIYLYICRSIYLSICMSPPHRFSAKTPEWCIAEEGALY